MSPPDPSPVRPVRAGPVPLLLPAAGFALGAGCGAGLGGAGPFMPLGLALLVLALGARRAAPAAVLAGWICLGLAWSTPPAAPLPPERDGWLLYEVELGRVPVDPDAPRPVVLTRAWETPGPPWGDASRRPVAASLDSESVATEELGPGSRLLVLGRLVSDRAGRARLRVRIGGEVQRILSTPTAPATGALRFLRQRVRGAVDRTAGTEVRALFLALLLGDRSDLDPALLGRVRRTGTAHLLAISGLHVGACWAWTVAGATAVLARLPSRWTRSGLPHAGAALLAWCCAAAYVALAGAPVSGLRALAMLGAATLALVLRRRSSPLNLLAGAALGVVAWDPGAARDLGFQLSVVSVALLVAWTPRPPDGPRRLADRVTWWLKSAFWAGFLGTVATAPLVARTWGQIPVAGLWANAVAIPLLGVATVPLLLLGAGLSLVHPSLGSGLFALAGLPASAGLRALRVLGNPEVAPLVPWQPTIAEAAVVYAAFAVALSRWRLR